jgi:hypothetical protein
LGLNNQDVLPREPTPSELSQTHLHILGKQTITSEVESQFHGGLHLVHVLTAGTSSARKAIVDTAILKAYPRGHTNLRHWTISLCLTATYTRPSQWCDIPRNDASNVLQICRTATTFNAFFDATLDCVDVPRLGEAFI